ncbi:FkbM family methyltransferase [Seongchinamella unica]|uniref:FkbM family methyltransferase n=1 Tax=Seongchinamella unica TaxID=2547392 RepID=A0A4R5LQI9_9GAMM|nr:FkbM family methyltransferase [Seongchinamella unica]TDG12755.1 FkbM family methyltransferase [Seongchinamella unica]
MGAHHPKRFSNTYLFYKKGWSGINIDAMPGSMELFNRFRIRDINLELAIGQVLDELDYQMFNEPALNGFSRESGEERNAQISPYEIEKVIKVLVVPLAEVLDRYLPDRQLIDFLSVDVEGFDLEVLKSNDWENYRPKYVLVEVLRSGLQEVLNSATNKFLGKCRL